MSVTRADAPIPPEAIAVLQTFLDASLRKDEDTMRACLSQKTLESGNFNGANAGPDNVTYTLGEPAWENDSIVVPVTATPNPPAPDAEPRPEGFPEPTAMTLPAVLVPENGGWKFDLATTMDRMMGGSMQATMDQLADTMSQAVGAIGSAFSEGMQQAFGGGDDESDEGPIPDWNLVPLLPCVDEILQMPQMTPLPKLTTALTEALGHEVIAQVAMNDLLQQVGPGQHEVLLNWFEDQLFANWPAMLAEIANTQPLGGRLRAVRMEAASYHEHRFVAIDGNDLVYRLHVSDQAGYYGDDELAKILPGVLAGLPEGIDPSLADRRFLPDDSEYPNWDVYRERVVPRFMRRISHLLGKPVRLDADFHEVYDGATAARELSRWGINRIYGAIALACLDDAQRYHLSQDIKTIKLKMAHDDRGRFATFEDGVLEVGVQPALGEQGCFYEHELLPVLTGADTLDDPSDDATANDEETGEEGSGHSSYGVTEDMGGVSPETEGDRSNFDTAVQSLRENGEPAWRQQLETLFGRPMGLALDYDALDGEHDRLQPFIHQSLSGGMGALSMLSFDPAYREKLAPVQHVRITLPTDGKVPSARVLGNLLSIAVPLGADGPPPVQEVKAAICETLDRAAARAEEDRARSLDDTSDSPPDGEDFQLAAGPAGDRHEQAARYMDELEQVLRQENLWPGDKPDGEIEVKGAFGSENMAFEQWLAWVFIPRVREIIDSQGAFPGGSSVAAYAVREWDGHPNAGPVIDVLANFDQFITDLANQTT